MSQTSSHDLDECPAYREDHTDAVILEALLDKNAQRPWTVAEIAREHGLSDDDAADSVGRLARAALVHRLDGFVFASRAAVRAGTLSQHV